MTKDFMKSATMMDFTAFDIKCGCYTPKHQAQLMKKIRRSARRNYKNSLKKYLDR
mgnify:CR=1 FL=1